MCCWKAQANIKEYLLKSSWKKSVSERRSSQKNKKSARVRKSHDSQGVPWTENTLLIQHHLKKKIWFFFCM